MNVLTEHIKIMTELDKELTSNKISKQDYLKKKKSALINLCTKSGLTWDDKSKECRSHGLTVFRVN